MKFLTVSSPAIRRSSLVGAALLFSVLTVALQVRTIGLPYLKKEQLARHEAVLEGTSRDPWQYRVLSEYLVEGFVRLTTALPILDPVPVAFILFRVLQNTLLFLLAMLFYRRLGLDDYLTLLATSCLAWGMTHTYFDSDLQFNTYSDVIFYLLAALALLSARQHWIPFLVVLASLNRETSLLIPIMFLTYEFLVRPSPRPRRSLILGLLSLGLSVGILLTLRFHYGPRPPASTLPPMGLELLLYNLRRYQSWVFLFATMGLFPFMALATRDKSPRPLHVWFWTLVPVWIVVHFVSAVVAETRLFLVPFALIFVPGTIFGVLGREPQDSSLGGGGASS